MGRPKGSKSKNKDGYAERTKSIKEHYGDDIYKRWGKLGGNPILLKSFLVSATKSKEGLSGIKRSDTG